MDRYFKKMSLCSAATPDLEDAALPPGPVDLCPGPPGSPLCHWETWSKFPHFSESGESEAHWGTTEAECLDPLPGLRGLLALASSMPLRGTSLLQLHRKLPWAGTISLLFPQASSTELGGQLTINRKHLLLPVLF